MKKFLILLLFMTIYSCTTEQEMNTSISEEQIMDPQIINYTFNNTTYQVRYTLDEDEQMVPIQDQSFKIVQQIVDNNETLIFHFIDDNNYILFQSNQELENYLDEMGTPLIDNSLTNKNLNPYVAANLQMFIDSYFNGYQVYWGYTGIPGEPGCWQYSTAEERLRNFDVPYNWEVHISGPIFCFGNSSFGNNPNDKVSSLQVHNVFAQFYEHANYGGKSITRDARGGGSSSFNRLKSVGMGLFGNWDNEISSARLSY